MSSSLNFILPRLFSPPPVALPLSHPHPSLSSKEWRLQRALERERFISKWLPKTQTRLYADEINIDVLPCSRRVLPNWCQRSYITRARYEYWQEACSVIWLVADKTKPEQVLKVSRHTDRQTDSTTQPSETEQINEVKWHTTGGWWRIQILKALEYLKALSSYGWSICTNKSVQCI